MGDFKRVQATGFERGYRAWRLGFIENEVDDETTGTKSKVREPRLFPLNQNTSTPWEPHSGFDEATGQRYTGEIVSDWDPAEDAPIEQTTKGLYSLSDYEEMKNGYGRQGDITGALIPYGEVVLDSSNMKGYRSSKAKIVALFRTNKKCRLCDADATKFVNDSKTGDSSFFCEEHLEKLKRILSMSRFKKYSLDELLEALSKIYDAQVVDESLANLVNKID
jgi:hypothetical protein